MVVVSQYPPGLELGTCGAQIHYTFRSPTAASSFKGATMLDRSPDHKSDEAVDSYRN